MLIMNDIPSERRIKLGSAEHSEGLELTLISHKIPNKDLRPRIPCSASAVEGRRADKARERCG